MYSPKLEGLYILGLYWDNGKENGNCCNILGLYWGYMETLQCSVFLVWYAFWVRILIRTTKKVLHWRV